MSTSYGVEIESFADRHFIRSFSRKHKRSWDFTVYALIREFQTFDVIVERRIAEPITDKNANVAIYKTEFKIAGTQESRHGSGNRCIVAVHKDTCIVHVLLVYHKNDLSGHNETVEWKRIICDHYPAYASIL